MGLRVSSRALALVAGAAAFTSYRHWHLRWGATAGEVCAPMPGDELVARAPFVATRAITIDAPPGHVWPWLVQVGFSRAGFYSYDLLDNLGRHSARQIIEQFQDVAVGDRAAPMATPVTDETSFRVHALERDRSLVWSKPGSSWAWTLTPLDGDQTRLVTRLRTTYGGHEPARGLVGLLLLELGDFPMMRKMLLGIRERAETLTTP